MSLDTRKVIFTQVKPGSTVYGVAVLLEEAVPLPHQIEAGVDSSGVAALSSDSGSDNGQGVRLTFEGLTFNTQYTFYIVAKKNNKYSDVKKLNAYTMRSVLELRGALYKLSGDSVIVTGTLIDQINNQFIPGWMDFLPLNVKATLEATGGPNSKPTIRFTGSADERYSPGNIRFPISTFTKYLFFKANTASVRQTIWCNDVASNLFEVQIGWISNNLSVQYRNASPSTVTDHIPLDNPTGDNLVEIKFNSVAGNLSEYVVKVNGVNKIVRTNLIHINNNLATTDQIIGQIGGRSPSGGGFLPYSGDIHFDTMYGSYHTNEEGQAFYNWVNSYYGKSYIRTND